MGTTHVWLLSRDCHITDARGRPGMMFSGYRNWCTCELVTISKRSEEEERPPQGKKKTKTKTKNGRRQQQWRTSLTPTNTTTDRLWTSVWGGRPRQS